ncbi:MULTISPECIES: twin-arginine translocase subunit TatC [unclassified Bartonella]|uniref:twin-arginine translocase subunit TatC n=1 Tax=unclassified Bartonella TaxID=2645622 RepID=UPI0015FA63B9|nr:MULTISPECIES: twin-arginine translocase subunit TatC [unclassified Bartonella]UXN04371.1 twin-arginine translocase subunit TatC [Bartonella sp. HY406]UXN07365.1 twin-arginine translocase subunit TatC [Bartonella sp. HY761]
MSESKKIAADKTEDMDDSAAPLMDHLNELRSRLIWCIAAFMVAFVLCFAFAVDIFNFIVRPMQWAMVWHGDDPANLTLIYTDLFEFVFAKIKIAAFGGVVIAFPVIAIQLYRFIAPGLYKNERNAFLPFLIAGPLLFLVGAAVAYYLATPMVSWLALSMQQVAPAGGDLHGAAKIVLLNKVSEYLRRVISFVLVFGLIFQMPIVTSLLVKVGILSAQGLASKRRYAIVAMFVVAAIVAPPDVLSHITLALPMVLLYEISIIIARMIERGRKADNDSSA